MQQTADVEILWITVDAECLPAYGSFFSSAAVADGDAMATDVDVEMTAACGSSFFSAAVVVSATDAAMAVDADARQHNISCIGLKRRSHFSVSFFIYIYNADPGRSHYGRKTFKTNDTI